MSKLKPFKTRQIKLGKGYIAVYAYGDGRIEVKLKNATMNITIGKAPKWKIKKLLYSSGLTSLIQKESNQLLSLIGHEV